MEDSALKRALLIATGIVAVVLGTIGAFVPLLPTTPFLLLAAACFFRSSERLYNWLIHHRWFGAAIRNYREHHAIALRTKVFTLLLLWVTIGVSAVAVASSWWLRILLAAVAVGVTIHVLRMKTLTPEMLELSEAAPPDDPTHGAADSEPSAPPARRTADGAA